MITCKYNTKLQTILLFVRGDQAIKQSTRPIRARLWSRDLQTKHKVVHSNAARDTGQNIGCLGRTGLQSRDLENQNIVVHSSAARDTGKAWGAEGEAWQVSHGSQKHRL